MGFLTSLPVHRDLDQSTLAPIDERTLASLACDVSFTSDDSTPADALVAREIERIGDLGQANVYWSIFDRLRTVYDAGQTIAHPAGVATRIRQAVGDDARFPELLSFFDRVNGVMFQHQTLAWLVESQFKVHLYGAGWENNSFFARFARGAIDSDATRLAIYRASRINLAASVYGAVDSRVTEGITTGGFFLMRYTPADVIERIFPPLWVYCSKHGITNNAQLKDAPPSVQSLLAFASSTVGVDVLDAWPDLVTTLQQSAEGGYSQSAGAIWPQYPAVTFSTRDELIGLVSRYLYDGPLRQRMAQDMRSQLVARFEHVRINRTLSTPRTEVAA